MRMARLLTIGMCGVAGWLLLTGCGPNPDQLQIEAQAERINELVTENTDLRSRLARAISDRDAARTRAYALEQQVADLRHQLAARPPVEERGPWDTVGEFSWLDVGSDFLFDSGKATLKPAARGRLQEIVDDINASYADKMILVVGHTDNDPIKVTKHLYKDNLDLSQNRAATVYRELMKLGVDPQRMIAAGQGEYLPKASNDTKASKAQNRRVQFLAVPTPPAGGPTAATETPTASSGTAGNLVVK